MKSQHHHLVLTEDAASFSQKADGGPHSLARRRYCETWWLETQSGISMIVGSLEYSVGARMSVDKTREAMTVLKPERLKFPLTEFWSKIFTHHSVMRKHGLDWQLKSNLNSKAVLLFVFKYILNGIIITHIIITLASSSKRYVNVTAVWLLQLGPHYWMWKRTVMSYCFS